MSSCAKLAQGFNLLTFQGEKLSSMLSGGCEGTFCPRTRRMDLERELQPKLYRAVASRTDDRVARREVGCLCPIAERTVVGGVVAVMRAVVCAVGIGDGGTIEHVKHLEPELRSEALLECKVLE